MSFKRLFSERGTYDVTTPVSELQQRCNQLTDVITTTAGPSTGFNAPVEVHRDRRSPSISSRSSSGGSFTPAPSPMMQQHTFIQERPETMMQHTCMQQRPDVMMQQRPESMMQHRPESMMQHQRNMHVDAIVEVPPTNVGFRAFEMDQRSQKTERDNVSTASQGSKCENCMVNCLYYTNECCDCTIL